VQGAAQLVELWKVNFACSDAGGRISLRLTMAPSVKGLAAYKKKDGALSISKDQRSIVWQPHVGAREADKSVSIAVANITSKSDPA
jgi:hypothetical protein